MVTKPMLAAKADPDLIRYPVLATPKLDGIRCVVRRGRALTRSFLPVGNDHIRTWLESNMPDGVDGELLSGGFNTTTSVVGRQGGQAQFAYAVFDYVSSSIDEPYIKRMEKLAALKLPEPAVAILPVLIANADELLAFEEKCLAEGFEGVMIRKPTGPYKCGRSTVREGYLLKVKRFEDAEAIVIGTVEGRSNQNVAMRDNFGRTKRSTAKDGQVGRGTLGALICKDPTTGIEFRIGCGGDLGDRIWADRDAVIGRVVKYKHQPSGAKVAPRFPMFIGFREPWDL